MSELSIRLFGPFALAPKHEPLSRKGQWLLSLLVLRHGRELERSWLAGMLWPDTSEELALYNLRRELSHLRRALGPHKERLRSEAAHILSLDVSGASVDVVTFDQAVARGDESSLEQAVASYSGPLLEACTQEWVVEEREARSQAYLAALEKLAAHASARKEPALAVRHLRLAVAADPLRETAQRGLIEALAATGAYAAATQTYRDLRLTLERDLQSEPAPETRALHHRITGEGRTKATAPVAAPRGRVPRPLTRLVGRTRAIGEVAALLLSTRLVTLVGTGGVGKSRLAIEIAGSMLADFAAGLWFVELAALSDPALVASSVASAVGLRDPSPRPVPEALRDFLRDQRVLLVLDNCEHLIGACAELVAPLLSSCGGLRILATSREPLGIVGEIAWRVPSLGESDAVQLFLERAQEAQPASSLRANLETVSIVCQRLDGIPLAIELAAARTKALSIDHVAARLDDRFRLLTGGSRTALPRHQTLHATMEWSYQLLTEDERRLLRQLGVFAGGWTLEAAEQICDGAVLETLSSLVDKSLVVFEERYRMLETVRQYAREQLSAGGEGAQIRNRHLEYFVSLAEQAWPHIFGGESDKSWIARLEQEHDNLRAAFDWAEASATGAEAELRLAGALHWFWFARSHLAEGRDRVTAALRRKEGAPDAVKARALVAAGLVAMWMGDFARMRAPLSEALTCAERAGDDWLRAYAFCGLGAAALLTGDPVESRSRLERAVTIARDIHAEVLLTFTLYWLGSVNEALADFEAARHPLREAIALAREQQNKPGVAHILYRLGHCAHAQGQYDDARAHYVGSLEVLVETGDQWGISQALDALGCLACAEGKAESAALLLGAAEALRQHVGAQIFPSEREDHDRAVLAVRQALGDEAFSSAWARGRALRLEEALAIAGSATG